MPEVTDTNSEILPAGPAELKVASVPVKKKTVNNKIYYEFEFEGKFGEDFKSSKLFFWPSEMKDLLLAIGGKEDPAPANKGKIIWEKEEVKGRAISCTVVHVPQRKDPTRMDVKFKDIKESVPF